VTAKTVLVHPRLVLSPVGADPSKALQTFLCEDSLGRVLVTLPSIHGGFELRVSTEAGVEALSVSAQQRFASLEASWLRDGVVNVTPLKEGVFAAMLYDVVSSIATSELKSGSFFSGDRVSSHVAELRRLLNNWFIAPPLHDYRAKKLAYRLSQPYPNHTLKLATLDAKDRATTRCLQHACEGTPYRVYLANISREIEGTSEQYANVETTPAPSCGRQWDINDIAKDTITVTQVVDLKNVEVSTGVGFNRSWIVQDDVYSPNRYPDKERDVRDAVFCYYDDESGIRHSYNDTVCPARDVPMSC
jgi:hypothetical protein